MTQRAGASVGAFFDVDGTLLDTTIVHFYARLMTDGMSAARRALWTVGFAPRLPLFLAVDRISRATFNRMFYRLYGGYDAAGIRERAARIVPDYATGKLYDDARQAVASHRDAGHTVALVTGTADFVALPVASLLGIDDVLATRLEERDGRLTGEIAGAPLSGKRKAEVMTEFAEQRSIDLSVSYAYGDSTADAEMLAAVGNAVAVNPSRRMTREAMLRRWDTRSWR